VMKFPLFLLSGLSLLLPAATCAQRPAAADSLSPDRLAAYSFANDAYFRTDYYFTQGMTGMVVHPALRRLPGARLLRLRPAPAGSWHGLRVYYDGFTPLRIQDSFIRRGDRPYAAYIYADFFRQANLRPDRRLTTSLSLGFIGPAAGAKGFQTKLHELLGAPTPRGWDYQVRNDLVLGYSARLEQRLLALGRGAELLGGTTAALSTLRTYAAADARLRLGLLNPYLSDLGVSSRAHRPPGARRVQLFAEGQLEGRLIGYDATLQGGLLRHDNPYELPAGAIRRGVLRGTGTLGLGYAGLRVLASAVHTSPEFDGARPHRWTQLAVQVAF
jgi:lipid A 3-O-deacylase